ncbi:Integrase [Nocardioides scoriae]|uniref:Integrase n=1 Tax=Nocardioides scoriae TaxID=642780 RepID=A0A1H1VG13_9ACTN|nr:Integrase [Nocardioides scoriae]
MAGVFTAGQGSSQSAHGAPANNTANNTAASRAQQQSGQRSGQQFGQQFGQGSDAPTVAEFYARVVTPVARAASGAEKRGGGLFRTYDSYWKVLVSGYPYQRCGVATRSGDIVGGDPVPPDERLYDGLGDVKLTDVHYSDLVKWLGWCRVRAELAEHKASLRRERRGLTVRHSDQEGAVRNAVGAIRYFFTQAVLDGQLPADSDVSQRLRKPGKRPSTRRAFTASEYEELWRVVSSGGDDPELDSLLLETVLVTGARREGLVNLNCNHLDYQRVTLWLDEKNGRVSEQPVTTDLLRRLSVFAASRFSATGTDPVFSFKDAITDRRPHRITDRRFDTLHKRIQRELGWADRLGVTLHWARHHAITTVERVSSEAVAARFARHTAQGGVTRTYDKASGEEVCAVVGWMTGTEHPLAGGGW